MRLVADIGGTNSRLRLSSKSELLASTIQSYSNANWESLYAVIADYLSRAGTSHPSEIVLALAGPVQGERAFLTNRDWVIDTSHLKEMFGLARVYLLNDFTALGYAVPKLKPVQIVPVNGKPGARKITAAIDHYAALLGQLLRDLSLAYLPSSGIYLAGGVARSIAQTAPEACIEALREPFDIQMVKDAPVWVIQSDLAALSGCVDFEFG